MSPLCLSRGGDSPLHSGESQRSKEVSRVLLTWPRISQLSSAHSAQPHLSPGTPGTPLPQGLHRGCSPGPQTHTQLTPSPPRVSASPSLATLRPYHPAPAPTPNSQSPLRHPLHSCFIQASPSDILYNSLKEVRIVYRLTPDTPCWLHRGKLFSWFAHPHATSSWNPA